MSFGKVSLASAALLLVAGLSLQACSNSANDPSDKVETALKNANLPDVDVDYDRAERVVHLKGTVDNPVDRTRAEQVAERAVGTSGKTLNELTVKGMDEKTADDNDGKIKDQLKEMVANDPELKQHDLSFTVNNGAVGVSGSVATKSEKSRDRDGAVSGRRAGCGERAAGRPGRGENAEGESEGEAAAITGESRIKRRLTCPRSTFAASQRSPVSARVD